MRTEHSLQPIDPPWSGCVYSSCALWLNTRLLGKLALGPRKQIDGAQSGS